MNGLLKQLTYQLIYEQHPLKRQRFVNEEIMYTDNERITTVVPTT